MNGKIIELSIVGAACVLAAGIDIRTHRIPNWLTGGLALLVFLFAAFQGWQIFAWSVVAFAMLFAIGFVVHIAGWTGGGDVKLLSALGAFFGFPGAMMLMLFTAAAGGLCAALWIASRRFRRVSLAQARRERMPYGPAILVGFLAMLLFGIWIPSLRIPL